MAYAVSAVPVQLLAYCPMGHDWHPLLPSYTVHGWARMDADRVYNKLVH